MSASPDKAAEMTRFQTICAKLDAVGSFRVDGELLEASSEIGSPAVVARFTSLATDMDRAVIADAPDDLRFMAGLVRRAIAARKPAPEQGAPEDPWDAMRRERAPGRGHKPGTRPDPKDYAAQAAIACGRPAFWQFLVEKHGLEAPLTAERAAQKVRSLCGVSSRSEFNTDGKAAAAWRALNGAFEAWKRVGR